MLLVVTMFYIISFRLSLKGLNTTTSTFTQLRPPLSNWTSHRQELHAAHAVLELVLGIRLINSIYIYTSHVYCFMLAFLYSLCVLSAFFNKRILHCILYVRHKCLQFGILYIFLKSFPHRAMHPFHRTAFMDSAALLNIFLCSFSLNLLVWFVQ